MEQQQNNSSSDQQKLNFIDTIIGTGFFTGYVPAAAGTFGSLVAAAFFFLPTFSDPYILIPSTIVLFIIGGIVAGRMEKIHGQDPSIVTVDEFVGMWISMWYIPFSLLNLALAFVVFRVLDILKPYPAADIDKKSGGWNIMLDDVIAGFYTNIILQIAFRVTIFS